MGGLRTFCVCPLYPITLIQDQHGDPWFVAKEVCEVLELTDTYNAVKGLDEDEKDTTTVRTLGGNQRVTIISESGLYTLVLRSRKPEAREFRRWVTGEVLPSIRKKGSYEVKERMEEEVDDEVDDEVGDLIVSSIILSHLLYCLTYYIVSPIILFIL